MLSAFINNQPFRSLICHQLCSIPYQYMCNTTGGGYAVLGAAKQVWESEKMLDQVFALEEKGEIGFMSMQMLPLDRSMDFAHKEYSTDDQPTQSDIDWDTKEEMYVLCTVRKL